MVGSAACGPTVARERPNLDTLTREQMTAAHFQNAFDAVQAIRGSWLNVLPTSGIFQDPVVVYLDGIQLGNASELRYIPMSSIVYIQHYDAYEATTRWGRGHTQGAIYVSSHPR